MKWRVVTENVVDLDWDHVEWTEEGKEYLLECATGCNAQEWAVFEENWLTEALLAAKEESHVGNLEGTIWFGLDKDGKCHVATDGLDRDWILQTMYGYLGFTTSEDAPLLDKAETFAEAV